jgi:hypothetical protein
MQPRVAAGMMLLQRFFRRGYAPVKSSKKTE